MNDRIGVSSGIALADEIESEILNSRLEPGVLFATEEELKPKFDSGRSTIRQAVRILEQRGVAYMRRGIGGGLIVKEVSSESVGRMLAIYLQSQLHDFFDLLRLVRATDSAVIPSGATNATLADCDALRLQVAKVEEMSTEEFRESRGHWRILHGSLKSISSPSAMLVYQTWVECHSDMLPYQMTLSETRRRGEFWALSVQCVEAIMAGDVGMLMELRGRQLKLSLEWHAWRKMEGRRPEISEAAAANPGEAKAGKHGADRLIRELLHEIRAKGWAPNVKLGGYAELMERYDVSSAVLRQATRMLEQCSAVYSRRGRYGGVFIGEPDREAMLQRALGYLKRNSRDTAALREHLLQVLLESLTQIHERANATTIRLLAEDIRQAAAGDCSVLPAHLCLTMARSSGNAALSVWGELLVETLRANLSDWKGGVDEARAAMVKRIYRDMLASLEAHDSARMRRCLLELSRRISIIGVESSGKEERLLV